MTHRGPFQPLPFCDSVSHSLLQIRYPNGSLPGRRNEKGQGYQCPTAESNEASVGYMGDGCPHLNITYGSILQEVSKVLGHL